MSDPSRKAGWPAAAALVVSASLAVATACAGGGESTPTSAAPVVHAATALVEVSNLPQEVGLYGTVEADRTAAVSTRVMAMVTAVHVQAGDPVRQGQLLLEIDPQAAQGQLSQAKGALAQAEAGLALAERNYKRFQALAESQAASDLEVDMARMQYEQARGAVEQAQGAVAAASSVASDSRVVAPFSGRVVQRMVEVGDLAAPGRPLLILQSTGSRRVALAVPETVMAASGLAPGSTVSVRIDSRPDLGDLAGRVVEATPGADPMTHSFTVKVEVPDADLPTGAAARASLPTGERQALLVPAAAVLRQGGMSLVVIREADGRASTRVVTLGGDRSDGRVEVLSGLSAGETVLVGLAMAPPAGATVSAAAAAGAEEGSR